VSSVSEKDQLKIYPQEYVPATEFKVDTKVRNYLLNAILDATPEETDVDKDIFQVMAKRRSTRKFSSKRGEPSKVDELLDAADNTHLRKFSRL
jgi:FMN reductase [NAD(P)H]